ncbi:DUF6522 family protein [Mesorhizobium sp. 2RAF21]|uniref:DUF6522 family protein n=1 Tax=Mesorhizobium sp. 2RAF21 TaxID=3232995 RepID=UPI003F9BA97C
MKLERQEGMFTIEASLLSELLDVQPYDIQALMRSNEITSLCERGEGEHEGQFRLTFFCKGRRARLNVDEAGRIVRRSIVDYGERPLAAADRSMERAGRIADSLELGIASQQSLSAASGSAFLQTSDSHVTKDDKNDYREPA